ncbi:hypothetical protein AB1Y20_012835 [Prymnesium parvum]
MHSTISSVLSSQPCPIDGTVAIVGGGVSGLAAAHCLSLLSCDVLLLEAQETLGGRTQTIRSGPFAGKELGAQWVHGGESNLVLRPLLAALNLTMRPTRGDEVYQQGLYAPATLADGTRLTAAEIASSFDLFAAAFKEMASLHASRRRLGQPDLPIGAAYDEVLSSKPWDERTRALVGWHFTFLVEGDDGALLHGPRGLSLDDTFGAAEYTSFYHYDGGRRPVNHDYVPSSGYSSLVDALASRATAAGVRLLLGASGEVLSIARTSGGVSLTTAAGAVHAARHALVTLPLGVLQARPSLFSPPLPPPHLAAIASLAMGTLDKLLLAWPAPRWPANASGFGFVSPTPGYLPVALNEGAALAFLSGGANALALEPLSDAAAAAAALPVLRTLLGAATPPPLHTLATRWAACRHTRGAYSYVPVNASSAAMARLAAPAWGGALRFGGEASCRRMYATVHGAYVAGLREAAALLGAEGARRAEAAWPLLRAARYCEEPAAGEGGAAPFVRRRAEEWLRRAARRRE